MDRDKQIELYREFLLKCTRNPNSANNYSDFKRINECLTLLFPKRGDLSILDFDDPEEFNSVVERLNKLQQYIDYNQKGKNQYSNAVAFYQCYLNAKKLFIDARKEKKANKGICSRAFQQIFYGAPGTGKSHIIKEQTKGEDVIRTTFHPDTDYSTFVGTYKPTTEFFPVLAIIGDKAVETGREEKRISYEFVCQAFLQAYVNAWKKVAEAQGGTPQKQFLVIEEINRGNCAQIFGDLFQLLDRNDFGYSDYPIKADADMQKQLKWLFGGVEIENAESINALYDGRDIVEEVLSGEVLLLPNNLYIWATMNTSDQSLFPIDSAFKRRWDWQYTPISDGKKGWQIEANGYRYDWWQFLQKMNDRIGSSTHSEDKKLGYFFCKAKNGTIDAETFVGKVIFYIWNDVFKDFAEEAGDLFKDVDGTPLYFNKFYTVGKYDKVKVVEEKIVTFMANLGIEIVDNIEPKLFVDNSFPKDKEHLKIIFPNGTIIERNNAAQAFAEYVEIVGPEKVESLGKIHNGGPLISPNEIFIEGKRRNQQQLSNGFWLSTDSSTDVKMKYIRQISDKLELGVDVTIL